MGTYDSTTVQTVEILSKGKASVLDTELVAVSAGHTPIVRQVLTIEHHSVVSQAWVVEQISIPEMMEHTCDSKQVVAGLHDSAVVHKVEHSSWIEQVAEVKAEHEPIVWKTSDEKQPSLVEQASEV